MTAVKILIESLMELNKRIPESMWKNKRAEINQGISDNKNK